MLRATSLSFLGGLAMAVSAFGAVPAPGSISYLEGRTWVGSKALTSVGQAAREPLQPGEVLTTGNGKAEILLTPGTYLRLSENSAVRMVSPSLSNTEVEVLKGQALVDVAALRKENRIRISGRGASVMPLKDGLYRLDVDEPVVSVFDGKALVARGDRTIELTKGRQAILAPGSLEVRKFDRDEAKDDLYRWSKLRSEYLQAANAPRVVLGNRWGWYGDPWLYGRGYGHGWSFGYGHGFGHFGGHH